MNSYAITVLGTGAMGAGMAGNLAEAGHLVTVWNRTPSTARRLADGHERIAAEDDLRRAVGTAELVMAMVTDDDASRRVWLDETDGALAALRPDAIVVESSTISPAWAIELGTHVADRGHRFLEAPVVGSRPQLAARQLRYLTAGDDATLAAARPVLEASAAAIEHLGAIGNAATMKLAVNGLLAIQVAAVGEIIGMLHRAPIDDGTALALLAELPITSPALARIIGLIGSGDLDPNFTIDLATKDLGYLTRTAATSGASTPVSDRAHEVFSLVSRDGHGSDDIAAISCSYLP